MLHFIDIGGPMMYPLLACSLLTVAFIIERSIHFFRAGCSPESIRTIHDLIENKRLDEALQLAEVTPGPVSAILSEGIMHAGEKKEALEEEITLTGTAELKRLGKNLHLIELVSRVAPLIGLLGTVLGMVEAFRQVAGANGSVNPSMLAGGIWEALLTTVAGLGVGIPAMIAHHLLEERIRSFSFQMKFYGSEIIKHLGT